MLSAFRDLKIWVRLTSVVALMLAVSWAFVIEWEHRAVEKLSIDQATDFSLSMHDTTMAGLTALMIADAMKKKNALLDQVKQLSVIRDLRVVPSEVALIGVESSADEGKKRDDLIADAREASVLKSGNEVIEVRDDGRGPYLLAIRPLKNVKSYLGKNCLECHDADENAVLGVISMKISLAKVDAANNSQRNASIAMADRHRRAPDGAGLVLCPEFRDATAQHHDEWPA